MFEEAGKNVLLRSRLRCCFWSQYVIANMIVALELVAMGILKCI